MKPESGPQPRVPDQVATQGERREQTERDRLAVQCAENARHAEAAPRGGLAGLVVEGDGVWARVAARIAEKKPSGYAVTVDLLVDLREVTGADDRARRLKSLRHRHSRDGFLVERLGQAGL